MELKAEANPRIVLTLDNKAEITFTISKSALNGFELLTDKELLLKVKPFQKRRSLSQNAYMWTLIGELSQKMNISKEQVYRNFIKDYGIFEVLPIKEEAVDRFIFGWNSRGLGWVCEVLRDSKINGFKTVIAYYGSSSYKSDEMKNLLDAIIYECKELGISTMTMAEIMLLQNENDT